MLDVRQTELETGLNPGKGQACGWRNKDGKKQLVYHKQKGTHHLEILCIIYCGEDRAQGYHEAYFYYIVIVQAVSVCLSGINSVPTTTKTLLDFVSWWFMKEETVEKSKKSKSFNNLQNWKNSVVCWCLSGGWPRLPPRSWRAGNSRSWRMCRGTTCPHTPPHLLHPPPAGKDFIHR